MGYDFSNLEKDIEDTVNKALNSQDFKDLKQELKSIGKTIKEETKKYTGTTRSQIIVPKIDKPVKRDLATTSMATQSTLSVLALIALYTYTIIQGLFIVFGFIFSLITFNLASILESFITVGIGQLIGFTLGILGIIVCTKIYGVTSRYKRIAKFLYKQDTWTIEEIANKCKRPVAAMKAEVVKWTKKGYFHECYLTQDESSLIVGKENHGFYLEALDKQYQEAARIEAESKLDPIILQGRKYILEVNKANEQLPDEVISEKLSLLETTLIKLFSYLEKRPSKINSIAKFMDYYMPTTMKLVHSYCELEAHSMEVNNVKQMKQEILEVLDTINDGFISLFDELYKDDVIDISSDISVLKTMLKQDGYLEDN